MKYFDSGEPEHFDIVKRAWTTFVVIYEPNEWREDRNSDEITYLIQYRYKHLTVAQRFALVDELRLIAAAIEKDSLPEDTD